MKITGKQIFLTLTAALPLLMSGCASKGDVTALQNEWEKFEKGYDPSLRVELESNIQTYEKLNDEMRVLVNETKHKANRVSQLLAQIDNNELDQAVQACEQTRAEAERMCEEKRSEAAHNAQMAQKYAEEAGAVSNALLERHETNNRAFTREIKMMKVEIGRLEKALGEVKKKESKRGLKQEVEGMRKRLKALEKELDKLKEK